MKKFIKQKSQPEQQGEQSIDILKRVAKRVEEATVDISSIKTDIKFVKFRLTGVEHNTEIMKVDIEKLKDEMGEVKTDMAGLKTDVTGLKTDVSEMKIDIRKTKEGLEGLEDRLGKRISHVADLITISLSKKLQKVGKRVTKVEKNQQIQQPA